MDKIGGRFTMKDIALFTILLIVFSIMGLFITACVPEGMTECCEPGFHCVKDFQIGEPDPNPPLGQCTTIENREQYPGLRICKCESICNEGELNRE